MDSEMRAVIREHDMRELAAALKPRAYRPWLATRHNLTREQKADIRSRYQAGTIGEDLAKEYGISRPLVARIAGKRTMRRFAPLPEYSRFDKVEPKRVGRPPAPPKPITAEDLPISRRHAWAIDKALKAYEAMPRVDPVKVALQRANPDGSRCIGDSACPFPAIAEGRCRQHLVDYHSDYSLIPATDIDVISGIGLL